MGETVINTDSNPKDRIGVTKAPIRLWPPLATVVGSMVMALGAKKYGPYNWREKKVQYSVYLEAAQRHIFAAFDGEDLDPESGLPHIAHAMACMAILLDADSTGKMIDDRPVPGASAAVMARYAVPSAKPTA